MDLKQFATAYKLRVKRMDEDSGDFAITGKAGQIYEYSEERLAVSFTPGLDKNHRGIGAWTPARWTKRKQKAMAAGMTLIQDGDSEGALAFDPENSEQAVIAMTIARIHPKRKASPEQLANLLNRKPPTLE